MLRRSWSLWPVVLAVVWLVAAAAVTAWAIPVFAQPVGCGLGRPCTARQSVEWLPSLATGAVAASVLVGLLVGAARALRSLSS